MEFGVPEPHAAGIGFVQRIAQQAWPLRGAADRHASIGENRLGERAFNPRQFGITCKKPAHFGDAVASTILPSIGPDLNQITPVGLPRDTVLGGDRSKRLQPAPGGLDVPAASAKAQSMVQRDRDAWRVTKFAS